MCLAQGNSKRICWLVLHTIHFKLSAKRGSCENHFLKCFSMTQLGKMNTKFTNCEADAQTTTLSPVKIESVKEGDKAKFKEELINREMKKLKN